MAMYKCKKCDFTFNPNDITSVYLVKRVSKIQVTYKNDKLWTNGIQEITFGSSQSAPSAAKEAYEEISDALVEREK